MSKRLQKAMDSLGEQTLKELEAMSKEQLQQRVVQADQAMAEAADELDNNPKYQGLKSDLKDLSAAKRDVNKRQKAIITVCLAHLESKEI